MRIRPLPSYTLERLEPRTLLAAPVNTLPVAVEDSSSVQLGSVLRQPKLTARAISPIQVDLQWTPLVALDRSRSEIVIERSDNGQPFALIASVPAERSSYSDIGLVSNSRYSYRVRLAGSVTFSRTAAATTHRYDAGLIEPFRHPSAVTGQVRNILNYGASPNNSSDNDSIALQNAINASAAGDEVYIPDGVYHLKSRDIRLKTGVSIRGESMTATVLSTQFTDAGSTNPNSQVFRASPGINNLTLSNFRIEMSGGQALQYGLYLGSGSNGVANVSRIAISNVNVEDFEKFAVAIRNGDNILVENSLLRNATALGGGGQGYGVMIGYDNSFNNWIKGNTIGPVIRHAVVVQYRAHHNLIERNVAIDNTLDSFDLHGEDEYSNEIRHNVAYGCGGFGIGIGNTGSTHNASGPDNWVHHNEVYNSRGGINVMLGSHAQFVEDNEFHHNSNEGILVNNGGGDDLWFLRNTIRFNGTGARIGDAGNLLMIGNTIVNNVGSGLILGATSLNYCIVRNDFRGNGLGVQIFSQDGLFAENLL